MYLRVRSYFSFIVGSKRGSMWFKLSKYNFLLNGFIIFHLSPRNPSMNRLIFKSYDDNGPIFAVKHEKYDFLAI